MCIQCKIRVQNIFLTFIRCVFESILSGQGHKSSAQCGLPVSNDCAGGFIRFASFSRALFDLNGVLVDEAELLESFSDFERGS